MDQLTSGTLPIIEYGGDRAIRQYAMWTILSISARSGLRPPLVSTALRALSALQHFSLWYLVIGWGRLGVKAGC